METIKIDAHWFMEITKNGRYVKTEFHSTDRGFQFGINTKVGMKTAKNLVWAFQCGLGRGAASALDEIRKVLGIYS